MRAKALTVVWPLLPALIISRFAFGECLLQGEPQHVAPGSLATAVVIDTGDAVAEADDSCRLARGKSLGHVVQRGCLVVGGECDTSRYAQEVEYE